MGSRPKPHPEPMDQIKITLAMRSVSQMCPGDRMASAQLCCTIIGRMVAPGREKMLVASHPVSSSRIKRNTSGDELVRCAVDAATAYENILNAIKAAEDAANKATSASESALQVGPRSSTGCLLDWLWRHLICLLFCAWNNIKNSIYSKSGLAICDRLELYVINLSLFLAWISAFTNYVISGV